MKYKWEFFAVILGAGITAGGSLMGQNLITKSNLELEIARLQSIENSAKYNLESERLKMQAESQEKKRLASEKRCEQMSHLYEQMNFKYQRIYVNSSPDDIHPTFLNLSDLNAQVQIALTYLSESSVAYLKVKHGEQSKKDADDPVKRLEPYILALREEVKSCNGPNSFVDL